MTEKCGWSEWLSPGQPAGTPGVCVACGINQTYGGVKRCMKRGRSAAASEPQLKRSVPPAAVSSGIGDRLESAFGAWWIKSAEACKCNDLRQKLNMMTAEQVLAWTELPSLILSNAQRLTGPVGLIVKALAALAPWFARRRIAAEIERAAKW